MKDITNENYEVREYHTLMDNGEKRFRLICDKDNTSYIRTEASSEGGLQNSHFHKKLKELYIVQKGKILIYELINNSLKKTLLTEGEYYLLEENISHNVYMYPNAITHTIKFGEVDNSDWNKDEELDFIIKQERKGE